LTVSAPFVAFFVGCGACCALALVAVALSRLKFRPLSLVLALAYMRIPPKSEKPLARRILPLSRFAPRAVDLGKGKRKAEFLISACFYALLYLNSDNVKYLFLFFLICRRCSFMMLYYVNI
jgi:hypothetical protein